MEVLQFSEADKLGFVLSFWILRMVIYFVMIPIMVGLQQTVYCILMYCSSLEFVVVWC